MSLQNLLPEPDQIHELDLDHLRAALSEADALMTRLEEKIRLYEPELQRELRAKIDLCGGIPQRPDPDAALALTGSELLAARRDASRKFNQTFYMAPLCRNAQKPNR